MKNSKIYQPIKIGGVTLRNRVMMAPMTLMMESMDGTVSNALQAHYLERARGGVAAIEMDAVTIDSNIIYRGPTTCMSEDKFISPMKEFTDKLHAEGCLLFPQLNHVGPESAIGFAGINPPAASVYTNDNGHLTSELTIPQIKEIIKQYGIAAKRAETAGCDGIQLHVAHAYMLPASFLSPMRNFRIDEYGGDIDNRSRFVCEVIDEIRKSVCRDFAIVMRVSGDERYRGGNTLNDMLYILPKIIAHGVDAIEVSGGAQYERPWSIIVGHGGPRGANLDQAAAIKKVVDVPVFVVGKIENMKYAEGIVEQGLVDGVTFGRPLLADPELVNKSRDDRFDEIAPCASCCGSCCGGISYEPGDYAAKCHINPRMGRETRFGTDIGKAEVIKRVLVIGGGPGGLMAAKTAAERGHKVTLWEKERLGGQVNLVARAPGKQDDVKWIQYLVNECGRLGVDIQVGKEATAECIRAFAPDAAIVATGAKPLIPDIPGVREHDIVTAQDFLGGKYALSDGRVCILGGGIVAFETAEAVVQAHRYTLHGDMSVDMIEMQPRIAAALSNYNREPAMRHLAQENVKLNMYTNTKLLEYRGKTILVEREDGTQKELGPYDHILFSMGSRSYNTLSDTIAGFVPEVKVIGDAREARYVLHATREGFDAAIEL